MVGAGHPPKGNFLAGSASGLRTATDRWSALVVGLFAAAVVTVHLFFPTVIGTADTGDGLRLLCQIQAGDPRFYEARTSAERFVTIKYQHIPPNPTACGDFRVTERYPSSALLVLAGAQQLTEMTGRSYALDMRFTGFIYLVLYGLVVGALVLVLPGPRWARVLTAGAVGLLGADATFVPYFISPFSEPMEYVALLATFATMLALWRRRVVRKGLVVGSAMVFLNLIGSKAQEIPLGTVLAGVLLAVRCPLGRWKGTCLDRLLPGVAALCVLAGAGTVLSLQPRLYNEQLLYTDVFYTILKDSTNVPADLEELGLPQELARYAGRTYFEVRSETATDPSYRTFVEHISFADIARFYAGHPDRLGSVSRAAIEFVVKARHPLPNTTRGDTARPEVVCRICVIPTIGSAMTPLAVVLWPAWEFTILAVGALLTRRRWHDLEWRALGMLLVTTVAFAIFHTATAILGDGYAELGKHVFPAVVDTWMTIPLVALGVFGLRARSHRG
ncbi:glycan biosynthesis hexose transferase WsfD [Terrabacter koreensis]